MSSGSSFASVISVFRSFSHYGQMASVEDVIKAYEKQELPKLYDMMDMRSFEYTDIPEGIINEFKKVDGKKKFSPVILMSMLNSGYSIPLSLNVAGFGIKMIKELGYELNERILKEEIGDGLSIENGPIIEIKYKEKGAMKGKVKELSEYGFRDIYKITRGKILMICKIPDRKTEIKGFKMSPTEAFIYRIALSNYISLCYAIKENKALIIRDRGAQ